MTHDQRTSEDARPSTEDIAAASHTHRDDPTETETMTGHDEGRGAEETRGGTEWSRDSDRAGTDRTRGTGDERMTDSDPTEDLTLTDDTGELDRTEQSGWPGAGRSTDQGRDVAADEEVRSGDWADSRGTSGAELTDADTAGSPDSAEGRWGESTTRPDGMDGTADMAGTDRTANSGWTDTHGDLAETDQGGAGGGADSADLTGASDQSAPRATGAEELPAELFQPEMVERFRGEWQRIQGRFVDDPQDAVRGADHLVAEVMQALATMFSEHKHELEGQWQQRSEAETEDLRLALRRYRSFFNQLLNA